MNGRFAVGSILMIIGVLFLLENTGVWNFGDVFHDYWPVLLILWGVWLLVRRRSGQRERPIAGPATALGAPDELNESVTLGDIEARTVSQKFRGGSVGNTIGDIRVDLFGAVPADGEQVLTVDGVIGDVRVTLPKDVATSVEASTTLGKLVINETRKGGFSPSLAVESPGYAAAPRRLRVKISHMIGDIEVRQ
jgi:lia operon protein LiaF